MNPDAVFSAMQHAVDCVHLSEHPVNKISACLFSPFEKREELSSTNIRPAQLRNEFALNERIGISSQYLHAETATLFQSHASTDGMAIAVTDPFCPNCAKNMAEAGIRSIFIDSKGLDKDFAKRRGPDFESMSLTIALKAGINVFIVNRKEQSITPVINPPHTTRPSPSGIEFFDIDPNDTLSNILKEFLERLPEQPFTIGFTTDLKTKKRIGILAIESLPPGFTPEHYQDSLKPHEGKYRYPIDPLNKLLFALKRQGMQLDNDTLASSHTPSSRALVNAVGFGTKEILIGKDTPEHDPYARSALEALNHVLKIVQL